MTLSLDRIELGVPDVPATQAFYSAAFELAAGVPSEYATIGLHGVGQIGLSSADPPAAIAGSGPSITGFGGCVLNYIVSQPSEVTSIAQSADRNGAKILKPPKKGFFGGFSAAFQTADGTVWKLAAPTKKDTGPAGKPPTPTEVVVILGVADPSASKAFYQSLGMTVDRDYGNKFVDFQYAPGSCRLGIMGRKELAKDVGVEPGDDEFRSTTLTHTVESRGEVDALLTAASDAGGRISVAASATDDGRYRGSFADPDAYVWTVSTT